ncbi:MAG: FAD-dependent oxidoreductase, partial [Actinomycetales bacterium]|nr:FAD-dependent oxidoreductase [Actinomycetales bacterium]
MRTRSPAWWHIFTSTRCSSNARVAVVRAVVIGGGIAGLASARRLALLGHEVALLEASDRLGGLIHSVDLDGQQVDVGAEAF